MLCYTETGTQLDGTKANPETSRLMILMRGNQKQGSLKNLLKLYSKK